MARNVPITVAKGDGIGPEIMDATLQILKGAGARIDFEEIEIGEKVYLRGNSAGIEKSSLDSLLHTRIFLKAPITTPQGGGFKSLNVTTRKLLGLYANVRPCVAYDPYIPTKHPGMDVVIVRENEEDLYACIEHKQTPDVTQWLKTIEDGIHTYDIAKDGRNPHTKQQVGTKEFAQAVVERIGQRPGKLKSVSYKSAPKQTVAERAPAAAVSVKREFVGVDLLIYNPPDDPNAVGLKVESLNGEGLKLIMISNRGVKVYPDPLPDTITTDNWRCRFQIDNRNPAVSHAQVVRLLERAAAAGVEFIKTEGLYSFDGKPGFSLGQGQ